MITYIYVCEVCHKLITYASIVNEQDATFLKWKNMYNSNLWYCADCKEYKKLKCEIEYDLESSLDIQMSI